VRVTKVGRLRVYRAAVTLIIPALVGAAFGTASSLLVFRYQQSTAAESLRTAFVGEIEAILAAVRRPVRFAADAWEKKSNLEDHHFYYPRAVFDGNVGRLGELRDKKLVRDIAHLYATLELAREEGRRLKDGTADAEGMLRYVSYLCDAFGGSMNLIVQLTGEPPRVRDEDTDHALIVNLEAMKNDQEFLFATLMKLRKAALPTPPAPGRVTK
jgi:hypothetical protein